MTVSNTVYAAQKPNKAISYQLFDYIGFIFQIGWHTPSANNEHLVAEMRGRQKKKKQFADTQVL